MDDARTAPDLAAIARQFSEQAGTIAMDRAHAEGATRHLLLEHLQPVTDETLLDLGSGPGATALAFAPYVARVIALDLATPMLRAARLAWRRAEAEPGDEAPPVPLVTVRGDAHRLPLRDRAVELVTMRLVAGHLAALDAALAEVRRVLRRGGRLGIVDPTAPDADGDTAAVVGMLERLRDATVTRVRRPVQWRAALEHAGLRVDFVEPRAFDLAEPVSLTAWFAVAGASSDRLAEAKRLLLTAPRDVRETLRVRTTGDDVTFQRALVVMTAMRTD